MINEDDEINLSANSWLWSDCKLVLRRTNPNNLTEESYQNLEAQVELECEQIAEPFIPILSFQHPFIQDASLSYSWRKGAPLPTLTVKLQESYYNLLKQDQQLQMIYCELTVAYPKIKQTHFYLEEVKTLGDKRKQFSNQGIAQFTDILLKQYSNQNGNNKFSLLIKICASSAEQSRIILKTLISTAFFVFNSRIKRKNRKPKVAIKLISPKKFLKPLTYLEDLQEDFNQESILKFIKNFNKSARNLSQTHPLHMIYHYSEFLRLYYNSKEVTDLYELLETIAPGIDEGHQFINIKKCSLKYELKKTKRIKKSRKNSEIKKRKKLEFIIKTVPTQESNQENKLLLVTFKQDILQKITSIVNNQKIKSAQSAQSAESVFEAELKQQIETLSKIFTQWKSFSIEIDLLREEPESVYWKDIHKEKVYEAYSKHYQMTKNRLTEPFRETVSTMNQENHHQANSD